MKSDKKEVLMAGLGGGGILTAGLLIGKAASTQYKNVICFPSYDISKRGGKIKCTVIYSNEVIASPIIDQTSNVIVAEPRQLELYRNRICPGGTLVVESNNFEEESINDDVSVIKVPAIKTAIEISGTSQGAILVLVGALVAARELLPVELIEQELQDSFAGKEKALKNNLAAFRKGLTFA